MASARVSRTALPACLLFVFVPVLNSQELLARPHPVLPGGSATVGGMSPFQPGCSGSEPSAFNYRNAPVEPNVAVDPKNPQHLLGAWQQDRWTDGGASGLLSAVSMDGGHTWTQSSAAFSICEGGSYQRASDPWVAISPDGTAYFIALSLNVTNAATGPVAVQVSRSTDGGFAWGEPVTIDL